MKTAPARRHRHSIATAPLLDEPTRRRLLSLVAADHAISPTHIRSATLAEAVERLEAHLDRRRARKREPDRSP